MEGRLRLTLWGIAALIALSAPAELALSEHWETPPQWIPFGLSAVAALAIAAAVARPDRVSVRAARFAMIVVGLGGAFGVWEHLEHNADFAREIDSSLAGSDLMVAALTGANPLLAPGIYGVLALCGLAATWGHPALGGPGRPSAL